MDNYNGTDVDASEAIDRDIENYMAQLAEEEARDEALIAQYEEERANQYCIGDHDHHYWG